MLDIRVTVERTAIRRLLRLGAFDPGRLDPLREALVALRRAARVGEAMPYCRADLAFHSAMMDLSGSPLLKPIWDSLSRGGLVFLMQERSRAFDYEASVAEHELLLELIEQGETEMAELEVEAHALRSLGPRRVP